MQRGTALLPVKRLIKTLELCKDESVIVESTKTGIVLEAHGKRSELELTQDVSDFPDVAAFDGAAYYTVSATALRETIRRTLFAAGDQWSCHDAVLFESNGKTIDVVATCGQQMVWQQVGAKCVGKHRMNATVPVATLTLLGKILADKSDDADTGVFMTVVKNTVTFQCNGITLVSRLAECRFPEWRKIIPKTKTATTSVGCGELQAAIKRGSVVLDKTSHPDVTLTFHKGGASPRSQL